MSGFEFKIFQFIVLIISVMVHEVSHGYVAEKLGDPTARLAGRLTFNPIKHIDLFGSILLPLLLFFSNSPVLIGWAKPVPYNPYNLRDPKYGPLKVALAGPLSNILLALIFSLLVRFGMIYLPAQFILLLAIIILVNIALAVFNLLPIPPLDGSKILTLILPRRWSMAMENLGFSGIIVIFIFIYFFSWIINYAVVYSFAALVGPAVASLLFGGS
ncbi:MAG TPA: site-2 protease family protein [Candidatus Paceibacterota bacterium]